MPSGGFLVTVARKDRKAGIFGESGLGERKMAKNENGAARGFDAPGMEAVSAKTSSGMSNYFFGCLRHNGRIT